jgi:hypothetical protein
MRLKRENDNDTQIQQQQQPDSKRKLINITASGNTSSVNRYKRFNEWNGPSMCHLPGYIHSRADIFQPINVIQNRIRNSYFESKLREIEIYYGTTIKSGPGFGSDLFQDFNYIRQYMKATWVHQQQTELYKEYLYKYVCGSLTNKQRETQFITTSPQSGFEISPDPYCFRRVKSYVDFFVFVHCLGFRDFFTWESIIHYVEYVCNNDSVIGISDLCKIIDYYIRHKNFVASTNKSRSDKYHTVDELLYHVLNHCFISAILVLRSQHVITKLLSTNFINPNYILAFKCAKRVCTSCDVSSETCFIKKNDEEGGGGGGKGVVDVGNEQVMIQSSTCFMTPLSAAVLSTIPPMRSQIRPNSNLLKKSKRILEIFVCRQDIDINLLPYDKMSVEERVISMDYMCTNFFKTYSTYCWSSGTIFELMDKVNAVDAKNIIQRSKR